ncbi:hypothetical protein A2U01_0088562, partial [Trifolium medium]|nr:hypothetical protein [Trifolium medium]
MMEYINVVTYDSAIDQVTDVETDVIASDQQLQKNHPKELISGNPD